jgi:hypothetical protein
MQTLRDAFTDLTRAQRAWLGGGLVAVLAIFVVVVIISGGDESPVETTTTTTSPITTSAPATTVATTSTTTTTIAASPLDGPIWPLTGLPRPEAEVRAPLLAVKIDNSVNGRPQYGLEQADVVFDIPVEGGISRLLAFFQSQLPTEVGPVRSVREVDAKLLAPFEAFVAHSGGVAGIVAAVRAVATDLGHPVLGSSAYRRAADRPAPYNLIFDTEAGLAGIEDKAVPREYGFSFGEALPGELALTVEIASSNVHRVRYGYSAADGGYLRFHRSEPHLTARGEKVVAANVVVLVVEEIETGRTDSAGAPVPDFNVLGSGPAVVFREGEALSGRWERGRLVDFFRLFTEAGDEIYLAPGTTWIHLVSPGGSTEWR